MGRTPYSDIKRKIVFEYMDNYPGIPSNTLARILYRDMPEYFRNKEAARSYIRRYRGTTGKWHRAMTKITKYYQNV